MLPLPCRNHPHVCDRPRSPRRFLTPADPPDYEWSGGHSVAYGAIRALAYEARAHGSYVRVLYGDAGRQGDPWGGLRLEVSGLRVHFGAGLARFPHLINSDRTIMPDGYELMARGEIPGVMDFNQTDWRWVQDELDISSYLPKLFWDKLLAVYKDYQNRGRPLPNFQSHSAATAQGYAIRPDTRNCTSIHAEHLDPWLVREHMPLRFFNNVLARGFSDGLVYSAGDCVLNQFLAWSESDLLDLLQELSPQMDWKAVAKGLLPVPALSLFP